MPILTGPASSTDPCKSAANADAILFSTTSSSHASSLDSSSESAIATILRAAGISSLSLSLSAPPPSPSSEARALHNERTSARRGSFQSRPCSFHQRMILAISRCCRSCFSMAVICCSMSASCWLSFSPDGSLATASSVSRPPSSSSFLAAGFL